MNAYNDNRHTKKSATNLSYTYGTEAYDYDVIDRYNGQKEKKRKNNSQRKNGLSRGDIQFIKSLAICGFIVFLSAIGYINVYSTFNSTQLELKEKKEELIDVNSKISKCESILAENMDIDKITKKAMDLGYRKPLQYQIVYIVLPEHSRTYYAD